MCQNQVQVLVSGSAISTKAQSTGIAVHSENAFDDCVACPVPVARLQAVEACPGRMAHHKAHRTVLAGRSFPKNYLLCLDIDTLHFPSGIEPRMTLLGLSFFPPPRTVLTSRLGKVI